MAYVYRHIRPDKNEPFYIGIGSDDSGEYSRANSIFYRNKHWHHVVKKSNYDVEILLEDLTWEQACEKEKEFIKLYGRKDLGLGQLVNMTDGGEGSVGLKSTVESRQKNRLASLGKNNPMYGIRLDKDILDRIAKKQLGKIIINDGSINKQIDKNDLDFYISKGWIKGRHEKNKESNKLSRLGKTLTDNTKNKISNSLKGKSNIKLKNKSHNKIKCSYCDKVGGINNMKRYHFDNCKYKNNGI